MPATIANPMMTTDLSVGVHATMNRVVQKIVERIDRKATVRQLEKAKADFAASKKAAERELEAAQAAVDAHEYAKLMKRLEAAKAEVKKLSLDSALDPEGPECKRLKAELFQDAELDGDVQSALKRARLVIGRATQACHLSSPGTAKGWLDATAQSEKLSKAESELDSVVHKPDPIDAIKTLLRSVGLLRQYESED